MDNPALQQDFVTISNNVTISLTNLEKTIFFQTAKSESITDPIEASRLRSRTIQDPSIGMFATPVCGSFSSCRRNVTGFLWRVPDVCIECLCARVRARVHLGEGDDCDCYSGRRNLTTPLRRHIGAAFRSAPISNGHPSTWSTDFVQHWYIFAFCFCCPLCCPPRLLMCFRGVFRLHERAVPKALADVFHNFDGRQLLNLSKDQWIYYVGVSDGNSLFDELHAPYSYDVSALHKAFSV